MNIDRKTRIIIIIGCLVTFIVVPLVTTFILSLIAPQTNQEQPAPQEKKLTTRSNEELKTAIVGQTPVLVADGKPTFSIDNVATPQKGWYVVTIYLLDDPEKANPAKVLVQDTAEGDMRVLIGPGTYFPSDITQGMGIPDVVIGELNS